MGDTWGNEGPPEEAYSRVTRDLAVITAGFAEHLDELPARLLASYDCAVRDLTDDEVGRLSEHQSGFVEMYAVEPSDPDCATLLVGRQVYEGGTAATLAFGVAAVEAFPDCFCDACDEDSESLVEQLERFLGAATGGCHEFRRRYRSRPGERLDGGGPWLEHGVGWPGGSWCHASRSVTGEPFTRDWAPWPARSNLRA